LNQRDAAATAMLYDDFGNKRPLDPFKDEVALFVEVGTPAFDFHD
jgi:hypothetical protein